MGGPRMGLRWIPQDVDVAPVCETPAAKDHRARGIWKTLDKANARGRSSFRSVKRGCGRDGYCIYSGEYCRGIQAVRLPSVETLGSFKAPNHTRWRRRKE